MMRLVQIICLAVALSVGTGRIAAEAPPLSVPIADYEWDWEGFKRYWSRQLGQTSGVVGIVSMVVGTGVIIVLSSRRKS